MFQNISQALETLGRYFVFLGDTIRCVPKRPSRAAQCFSEIERIGVNSIMIIFLSGGAMGMIFALQLISFLQPFSAEIGAGAAVAIALSRELAPVITTLMLIAKNGSAMAAELGTMKVTEQIDAQSDVQLDSISRILESAALITERTERVLRDSEGGLFDSFSEIHEALVNLRLITAEITGGGGSLGQTIYDDGLYRSIISTAERTEDAAIKLVETLDGISGLIKTTDVILNNAGEVVEKAMGLGISVDTNARYDVLAQAMRAAASIRLDPASNTSWYRIGVSSAPDGAVDAELARRFGFLTLRDGILESTAGLGVDVQPFKWLSLSGEVFNFQTGELPNLRSTLTFYPFFDPDLDKPWNWLYLRGGVNNALNGDRDYFFGGGLRFADREVKGLIGLIPAFN